MVPVLVEPDIETYNIDAKKIEEKITGNTKAIMVVHLYGKICDMDSVMAIAKKYDLRVIEDCAQAHGAKYKNIKAGNFGDLNAFAFSQPRILRRTYLMLERIIQLLSSI